MFGKVNAHEGLHVTGECRDRSMQHTCSRNSAWDSHSHAHKDRVNMSSFTGGGGSFPCG